MNGVPALLKAPSSYPIVGVRLLTARLGLGMQGVVTRLREGEAIAIVAIASLLLGRLAVVREQ